ncbi:MAG: hypothetical protein M1127_00320 [Patescibacteria group bacterium]|nr:hypothetical protein [Patescibacteria group bacterium]
MAGDLVESFSGVRGIFGQSITEELISRYVFCYCRLFKSKLKTVVVGGDTRSSTPALKKSAIKAFSGCGIKKIIDVGVVPVQVAEYAIQKFKASGGAYITASHNEPEFNGWKFLKEDGAVLYPAQSAKLIALAHKLRGEKPSFNVQNKKTKTTVQKKQKEAAAHYINYVLKTLGPKTISLIKENKFKILLDPNGGASTETLEKLILAVGLKAQIINTKPGVFNRLVQPTVESLAYLNEKIARGNFDFAAGFDSDADRVEFVLPRKGEFAKTMGSGISGNYVLALACDAMLKGTKNQVVVTNDVTSYLVRDVIKKHKAKIKEAEVGEMPVVEKMEKYKSIVGGEGSNGGVIVPPVKCRDGIMTVCLLLKTMLEEKKCLDDILQTYPRYYSVHTKTSLPKEKALSVKKELESYYRRKGYKIKKIGGTTGNLKAHLDKNSYVWFRQSKTEPEMLRIYSEGDEKIKVGNLAEEGVKALENIIRQKVVLSKC